MWLDEIVVIPNAQTNFVFIKIKLLPVIIGIYDYVGIPKLFYNVSQGGGWVLLVTTHHY
jgi:hypothetical protein